MGFESGVVTPLGLAAAGRDAVIGRGGGAAGPLGRGGADLGGTALGGAVLGGTGPGRPGRDGAVLGGVEGATLGGTVCTRGVAVGCGAGCEVVPRVFSR